MEHHPQHCPGEVYVHIHQKLLPVSTNGQVLVYANEINICTQACITTIQSTRPCQKWICLSRYPLVHYGLPQSRKLSNKYLQYKLHPHRYYELSHIPSLWKHISCPIEFSLVVDDFDVEYVGEEHARHLINSLKEDFTILEYLTGGLYCGINLK